MSTEAQQDNTTSEPCSVCGRVVQWKKPPKRKILPQSWKRFRGEVICDTCWRAKYILRAFTLPVASPLDCSWEQLYEALREMWAATTTCSNWMTTQFYVRDQHREPGMEKMPVPPKIYLYPEARALFPALPARTVASLEQAVGKKYRAKRRDVIWRHAASLPTHRYPTPFPIPNQSWSVSMENGQPVISTDYGRGRERLRLRSGSEFRRQLAAIHAIVSGTADQGEMAIFRTGHGKATEIMCKMVAWVPRAVAREAEGTLIVRSGPDAILQAFNLKDEVVWSYHGDHLRRLVARHMKDLQNLADDSKAELRPTPPFSRRRRLMAERFRHRMDTDTHNIATMLVKYAQRRKFAEIDYDDSDHTFSDGMPWAELKRKIAEKADAAGIVFRPTEGVVASGEAEQKTMLPPANE